MHESRRAMAAESGIFSGSTTDGSAESSLDERSSVATTAGPPLVSRMVDPTDKLRASDVPADGTPAYFPANDISLLRMLRRRAFHPFAVVIGPAEGSIN